jgi:hypothetical protein
MVRSHDGAYRRAMTTTSPPPELAEPDASETPVSETEAAEIEERLRSLGYIE